MKALSSILPTPRWNDISSQFEARSPSVDEACQMNRIPADVPDVLGCAGVT
jgi:hypothetical protein